MPNVQDIKELNRCLDEERGSLVSLVSNAPFFDSVFDANRMGFLGICELDLSYALWSQYVGHMYESISIRTDPGNGSWGVRTGVLTIYNFLTDAEDKRVEKDRCQCNDRQW